MSKAKTKSVKNVAGLLDTRSQPDEVGLQSFSMVANASIRGRGRRCRRGGWRKLFDGVIETYNNHDLHDQLLGLLIYYEEFSSTVTIEPGFTGIYRYPYWYDGVHTPTRRIVHTYNQVCGYYLDYLAMGYDFPEGEGWGIREIENGYPYENNSADEGDCIYTETIYVGGPFDAVITYQWKTPSFVPVFVEIVPGTDIPGYFWGEPQPIYTAGDVYDYSYCGTYPYTLESCREVVNWIGSVGSPGGYRVLIAATKSRIYALNYSTGNWKILVDGQGSIFEEEDCETCINERWSGAVLDNTLVITNGQNPVLAYSLTDEPKGCDLHRAIPIPDLETLGVMSAGCVGSFKGFILLGDVHQDGFRYRSRIIWSDFNDPYSYVPSDSSLANAQDLGIDDTILRIESLNDYLFIYTDRAIYRGSLQVGSDGSTTFGFEEIYRGIDGALKYKYAFANTGDAHYYAGENRILKMTSFDKRPLEPIAIRSVSNAIWEGVDARISSKLHFEPLNEDACFSFVGGYNAQHKEVWFSWPTGSSVCPTMSMVINVTPSEEGVDFVDRGFNAFHWFNSRGTKTLMEWFEDLQLCPREDILSTLVKEGQPLKTVSDPFTSPVEYIWNEDEDDTEAPGPNSLCKKLEQFWIDDLCADCSTANRFVMASVFGGDFSLKEYTDNRYYREELNSQTSLYEMRGYTTILQSGAEDFQDAGEKSIHWLKPVYTALPQTIPSVLHLDIGTGPAPDCMRWKLIRFSEDCDTLVDGMSLSCLTMKSDPQHTEDHTRPDIDAEFPMDEVGKFIGYRLWIEGTGGACCFSKVDLGIGVP